MLMNSNAKVGLSFKIDTYCGKTGRLKGSSGKFCNRLISAVKNKMFVGIDPNNLQVGDNNADPIPNDVNVRSLIPINIWQYSTNGNSTIVSQSVNQMHVRHESIIRGTIQLADGVVKYIKEIGIIDFNRALVKSPSGKKYGLHVINGDIVDVTIVADYYLNIQNPTIPITLNSNGQFYQTVNATQQFYTDDYGLANPDFQLPAIHPDDGLNPYNWYDLLKGKSGIWMKGEINDPEDNWHSPEFINKNYDVVNDKNVFNANFLTISNTMVKQIIAYTGIRNVLLILTFDNYLTLPNEVTSISLEMKLTGDLS